MKDLVAKYGYVIFLIYGTYQLFGIQDEHQVAMEMLTQQIPALEAQIAKIKQRVENVKDNEAKLKESEQATEDYKRQIAEMKIKMPPTSEQALVSQELTNNANELNLKDVNLSLAPKQDKGMYFINGIKLNGNGTFLQFLIFFEHVLNSKRFFNIDELTITEHKTETKGRFIFVNVDASIQTFEYNENYVEPKAAPTVGPPKA